MTLIDAPMRCAFGPERPSDSPEGNWIQTTEGKGWFGILRLYSPGQSFFDKSWRPSEIEVASKALAFSDPQTNVQRKESTMAGPTTDTPVLDLLAGMTADSINASSLDQETLMLVRVAALAAVDAPPVSYALNLEAAGEAGIDPEQVRGVLAAIAPIVGTARVASATGNIVKAIALEIEVAELEEQDDEERDHK